MVSFRRGRGFRREVMAAYPPGNYSNISHQTGSSENHLQIYLGWGYMLVLRRVFCVFFFWGGGKKMASGKCFFFEIYMEI